MRVRCPTCSTAYAGPDELEEHFVRRDEANDSHRIADYAASGRSGRATRGVLAAWLRDDGYFVLDDVSSSVVDSGEPCLEASDEEGAQPGESARFASGSTIQSESPALVAAALEQKRINTALERANDAKRSYKHSRNEILRQQNKKVMAKTWNYFAEMSALVKAGHPLVRDHDARQRIGAVCTICLERNIVFFVPRQPADESKSWKTTNCKEHMASKHLEAFSMVDPAKARVSGKLQTHITSFARAERPPAPNGSPLGMALTSEIARMVVSANLPLHFVENLHFREILQQLAPGYRTCGRKTLFKHIDALYEVGCERLQAIMAEVDAFYLSVDGWSKYGMGYLCVCLHTITRDFECLALLLSVRPLPVSEGAHTLKKHAEDIVQVLEQHKVDKRKLLGVTTDGAANILNVGQHIDVGDEEQVATIYCFAHELQKVLKRFVNANAKVAELVQLAATIAGRVRSSNVAHQHLDKRLVCANNTRFSSSINCLQSVVEAREKLLTLPMSARTGHESLPALAQKIDFALGAEVVQVAQPIIALNDKLGSASVPTASRAVSMVLTAVKRLEECAKQLDDDGSKEASKLARDLAVDLNETFEHERNHAALAAAALLDHRLLKLDTYFNENAIDAGKQRIEDRLVAVFQKASDVADFIEAMTGVKVDLATLTRMAQHGDQGQRRRTVATVTPARLLDPDLLAQVTMAEGDGGGDDSSATSSESLSVRQVVAKHLVEEYAELQKLKTAAVARAVRSGDTALIAMESLVFWKAEQKRMPLLARAARMLLPLQATELACERVFSATEHMLPTRRNRTLPERLDRRAFVKCNMRTLALDLSAFNTAIEQEKAAGKKRRRDAREADQPAAPAD